MSRDLWILTTAPGKRAAEVQELFDSFRNISYTGLVVTNNPDPIDPESIAGAGVLTYDTDTEFNISKWWDFGLEHIRSLYDCSDEWDVLLIESDARMSRHDLEELRSAMRGHEVTMAGADWQNCLADDEVKVRRDNRVWIAEGKEAWQSRLPGMALLIAGEHELNHFPLNPRFWYSDDHLEWKARDLAGTVLVGGTTIYHSGTQGALNEELQRYADEDSKAFEDFWGGHPNLGGIPGA